MRRITFSGISITTAATHVCVLCMRYCNGNTAHILLHYVMKFHLEIAKAKERTDNIFIHTFRSPHVLRSFAGSSSHNVPKALVIVSGLFHSGTDQISITGIQSVRARIRSQALDDWTNYYYNYYYYYYFAFSPVCIL